MASDSKPAFLQHYAQARELAQENTILRLIYSAYNDQFITGKQLKFDVIDSQGHQTTLSGMEESFRFFYNHDPLEHVSITAISKGKTTKINDLSSFWNDIIQPYAKEKFATEFDSRKWELATYGLIYSLNTETLSTAKQLQLRHEMAIKIPTHMTTWKWYTDLAKSDPEQAETLMYQIGSLKGNTTHPLSKLRRRVDGGNGAALTDEEQIAYFSEFGNKFPLPLVAVSHTHMDVFAAGDKNYTSYFKEHFTTAYEQWQASLRKSGKNPDDYLPIPVHPLHMASMQQELSSWIDADDILLTNAAINVLPNISTRTTRSTQNHPHIKTTLPNIQITGNIRPIEKYQACGGTQMTQLARSIVKNNKGFDGCLRIVGEEFGLCFNPRNGNGDAAVNKAKILSSVIRENPTMAVKPGEFIIPLATAFYHVGKNPVTNEMNKPFIVDIVRNAGVTNADAAQEYFKHYVHTVVYGQLSLFARYGLAMEAHQQNTFLVFNEKGILNATVLQDLSGVTLYKPCLEYNADYEGFLRSQDKLPHYEKIMQDINMPLQKVLHTTFKSHLFPMAAVIAKEFGVSKADLLNIMKEETSQCLERAKTEQLVHISPQDQTAYLKNIEKIREDIMHNPSLDKAMLIMHIQNQYKRAGVNRENPFVQGNLIG